MDCEYGCGQKANHQLKNGKWCCCKSCNSCPAIRMKNSKANMGRIITIETRMKLRKYNLGKRKSPKTLQKLKISSKNTIEKIKDRYPFFSKIEKMRYNPDKPEEKEIQVHCKNHKCKNSKEQGGCFTPTFSQLAERIRQVEHVDGNGGSFFYCSEKCKNTCDLYRSQGADPFKQEDKKTYTQQEYEIYREFVLERDGYACQYCGEQATNVHHERPQKLEPFFSLDPDLAWSVCSSCHYEKGHPKGTKCSTGNLANKNCERNINGNSNNRAY